jgi:hypothetical protein
MGKKMNKEKVRSAMARGEDKSRFGSGESDGKMNK